MDNVLELRDVSKVYINGVYANKKVNFSVRRGEIHALVGENGAGKTTLMKIIFGMEKPDGGEIFLDGKKVEFRSPNDAIHYGIFMVHQHFMLVESLSVSENTALGCEDVKGVFIDREKIRDKTLSLIETYNLNLDPDALVADLSVGMKQRVEILKALYRNAKIIIFDEPTAVLTPQETIELFRQLKGLKEKGHTIIFISHKLHEVKELTDQVSILRKGEMIKTVNTENVNEQDISNLMIGETVNLEIEKKPQDRKEAVLDIEGLYAKNDVGKPLFENFFMKVRSGEILGLASIEGNGQQQLIEIITSQRKYDKGRVDFLDRPIIFDRIIASRKRGLGYIPSDRMALGTASDMSIEENLIANKLWDRQLYTGILTSPDKITSLSNELIQEYDIRTDSSKTRISMLSGGNIQKVVAAREFSIDARLIVADQPTRGIDVLAADFIHKTIVKLRDHGAAVLLASADLDELLKVSDSIIVMVAGKIGAYFEDASRVTQMELGNYMLGVKRMDESFIREKHYEA